MSSGMSSIRPQASIYPPLFLAVSAGEKAANSSEYAPYTAGLKRTLYGNMISEVNFEEHPYWLTIRARAGAGIVLCSSVRMRPGWTLYSCYPKSILRPIP
jgi:hypothetical protein